MFFSYAIVTPTTVTMYVDAEKLSLAVNGHLGDGVRIRPYDAIFEDSKLLGESLTKETTNPDQGSTEPSRKFLLSTKASWALSLNLGGEDKVEVGPPSLLSVLP